MLPEVAALRQTGASMRIPPADSVPLSNRVRRVIDTPPMRRLAAISQLGMVNLVYPGATHSRLEHSIGVYHNALQLLARFADDPVFTGLVDQRLADAFVLAALVHDVGHWPFCHPIEDMRLSQLGEHESRVEWYFAQSELAHCLRQDWHCELGDVLTLLRPSRNSTGLRPGHRFLASCLSGPIDIDKLDYLQRDSLHAGVPYGRHFDAGRLLSSMCIHPDSRSLAVGEKGRTAAEMMVFARYVMFSEVYWHHAVRSATAMLQRALFELETEFDLPASLDATENDWITSLRAAAAGTGVEPLTNGLFGAERALHKRVAEFNITEGAETHRLLARRPYWWLVACGRQLQQQLVERTALDIGAADILVDAPPVKLEVDINIDVVDRHGRIRALGDVSPIASVLASQHFDNYVKRVRVFVSAELRAKLDDRLTAEDWATELAEAVAELDRNTV